MGTRQNNEPSKKTVAHRGPIQPNTGGSKKTTAKKTNKKKTAAKKTTRKASAAKKSTAKKTATRKPRKSTAVRDAEQRATRKASK